MITNVFEPGTRLVSTPPRPGCAISVVIPVRDERDTIEATLASLTHQRSLTGQPLDPDWYEIIVLANNCRDDTASIARNFAGCHPQLALHVAEVTYPEPDAHVGRARRDLMDEACRRLLSTGKPRGIIATTDGDTLVDETWLAATHFEMQLGADAVGGRISIDPAALRSLGVQRFRYHLDDVGYRSLVTELETYLDPEPHDPWPRHFQHFGASMAVTVEMYLRAGGLPVQPWLEDVAFFNALTRVDVRIRHSPLVRVTTSARTHGRTGFGFAVQLTQWEEMQRAEVSSLVESATAVESYAKARQALRKAWQTPRSARIHQMAQQLLVDPGLVQYALAKSTTFGALRQMVEAEQERNGIWREVWPLVEIGQARWDLRCRLDELRRQRPALTFRKEIQPVQLTPATAEMD